MVRHGRETRPLPFADSWPALKGAAWQVLVTGSETTENYIMQTFTPPYLVGNPNRPQIGAVESNSWAWGEAYNVSVSWTQAVASVDRAVLYRCGGVTHSVHWDMRQVRA